VEKLKVSVGQERSDEFQPTNPPSEAASNLAFPLFLALPARKKAPRHHHILCFLAGELTMQRMDPWNWPLEADGGFRTCPANASRNGHRRTTLRERSTARIAKLPIFLSDLFEDILTGVGRTIDRLPISSFNRNFRSIVYRGFLPSALD